MDPWVEEIREREGHLQWMEKMQLRNPQGEAGFLVERNESERGLV